MSVTSRINEPTHLVYGDAIELQDYTVLDSRRCSDEFLANDSLHSVIRDNLANLLLNDPSFSSTSGACYDTPAEDDETLADYEIISREDYEESLSDEDTLVGEDDSIFEHADEFTDATEDDDDDIERIVAFEGPIEDFALFDEPFNFEEIGTTDYDMGVDYEADDELSDVESRVYQVTQTLPLQTPPPTPQEATLIDIDLHSEYYNSYRQFQEMLEAERERLLLQNLELQRFIQENRREDLVRPRHNSRYPIHRPSFLAGVIDEIKSRIH